MLGKLKIGVLALALGFGVVLAAGHLVIGDQAAADDQCGKQCYVQENACRKAKNGDPSCEAELTRCLQSCRAK